MQIFIKTIILSAILINLSFGKKINILYTSNINATYQNCECGPNPLGGIDRIKTFIENYCSKNKETLVVDGGNYFNSYSFPELNKKALKSLSMLNFDIFTPGIHIFLEEESLYEKYSRDYYEKIVNSNSNLNLKKYKDFTINDIKVRFFGFIFPGLFKHTKKPDWLTLTNRINNIEYLSDGINIILFNGYLEDAKEFLNKYKEFDALFLSSDQQTGKWKTGYTTIVGGGHDGESIALVEISIVKNNPQINVNYINMDSSIQPDESIIKLFKSIESNNN